MNINWTLNLKETGSGHDIPANYDMPKPSLKEREIKICSLAAVCKSIWHKNIKPFWVMGSEGGCAGLQTEAEDLNFKSNKNTTLRWKTF